MRKVLKFRMSDSVRVSALLLEARTAPSEDKISCDATLSIYPGFEELTADVLARLDTAWPIGVESRQFLPEVFLLDSFLNHPCRVPHDPSRWPLGGAAHFFVVPVLWRAVSILCASERPSGLMSGLQRLRQPKPAGGCTLASRATQLVAPIVNATLFQADA